MKPRPRGFALILVIWSLVLLSSLAGGFALAVRHEVRAASDAESVVRAEAAASAALHTTVLALGDHDPESRWRPDARARQLPWPGARITVRVRQENARIDINRASPELLAGLFTELFPDADGSTLADAVVDWRDSDEQPRDNGAERDAYTAAGYAYAPPNGPFRSVNEVGQVIGFDHAMLAMARRYLTIHSRQPRVNAMSADLLTLSAVPGIDRETAQAFVSQRERVLTEGGALDYTPLENGRRYLDTRSGGRFVSVDIEVHLDDGMKRHEQAIVRMDRARGYTLLQRGTLPVDTTQGGKDR